MKLTSQYGFQDLIDMKIYHKMVKCSYLYGYFFHMRSVWDQNFMCVCVWRLKLSQTFLSGSCVDPNVFLSVCLYVGSRWVKTVPSRLSFLFLCMCECVFVFVCVGGGVAWLGLFIGYKVVRLIQNISVVYELVFNCFRIFEVASKLLCGLFKTAMYFGIVRFKVTKSTRSSL